MALEKITKSYNSFSGCDMVVTCNILDQVITLGTLQTISYSIHMDRQPVRSIGNINAKDYTLGPRTIAGSLVFAVFDKHLLYHMIEAYRDTITKTVYKNEYTNIASKYKSLTNTRHILADELPPFDVTITFANEYGTRSKSAIYGVRLINEGQVMSINDIYTENTYQFVATDIDYMRNDDYYSAEEDDDDVESQYDISVGDGNYQNNVPSIKIYPYGEHDYNTGFSKIMIQKYDESVDLPNLLGGKLHVDDLTYNQRKTFIISLPCDNPEEYNLKLEENHKYYIQFIEDDTDIVSNVLSISIGSGTKILCPILEQVEYIDALEQNIKFRCLSALLYGHNKFYIKNKSTNTIAYSCDIPNNGLVVVSSTALTEYSNQPLQYLVYTSLNDSEISSENSFRFDGHNVIGIYNFMLQYDEFDNLRSIFESICNTYKFAANELHIKQLYEIRNSLSLDDLTLYELLKRMCQCESHYLYELNIFTDTAAVDGGYNDSYCIYYNNDTEVHHIINISEADYNTILTDSNIPNDSFVYVYKYNNNTISDCCSIFYKPNNDIIEMIFDPSSEVTSI